MSLFKYFGEQDDEHRGLLYWEALPVVGLPLRNVPNAPLLNREELESSIEVSFDFRAREFDLFDKQQFDEFAKIMDKIVNGWYKLLHIHRATDQQTGRVRYIYMEWVQRYAEASPSLKNRLNR